MGKYLTSYCKHLAIPSVDGVQTSPRASRLRLHILYIINDLLHHAKYHTSDTVLRSNLGSALEQCVVEVFQLAATDGKRKVCDRLDQLANIWQKEDYFPKDRIERLRKTQVKESGKEDNSVAASQQPGISTKEIPYIMPSTHGDPSTPYYDLPAGNLMPHILPDSTAPMQPNQIRALHFSAGPADEGLVNAVKDFLKDVEMLDNVYGQLDDEGIVVDIDQMGQTSYKDETGDLTGDTYYGWSRAFCDKMKRRRRRANGEDGSSNTRGRSRAYSSSPSRSNSPRKRRRYSTSGDRSESRSFSRSRSASRHASSNHPASQPVRARSRSRTSSPERPSFARASITEMHATLDRSASYLSQARPTPPPSSLRSTPALNPNMVQHCFPPPPPPLGHNGLPIPPPRPPNWSGPWPPLPPPPMRSSFPNMPFTPPPPPPPAPSSFQHQGQYGGYPGNGYYGSR